MKEISITNKTLWMCGSYYDKVVEHLEIMKNWKNNPDYVERFPYLFEHEFTLEDAFHDLLMKGGL